MGTCVIKNLKKMFICLILVFICGCKSCKVAEPIDYYNEIKSQFGEICLIRNYNNNIYFIKNKSGELWIVTMSYMRTGEGPEVYVFKKELIFTQD